jgi:putative glutamine amidotransferase
LPLLAICFGLQALNVYRGGTLVQHLPGIPINHAAGPQVSVAHGILIKPGSVLAHLGSAEVSGQAGEAEISKDQPTLSSPALRLSINSSHHQAIGALGAGLQVTARSATDDVVESIESAETGPFLLGLQWHPERSIEQSPLSRAIFARFIEEASDYAGLVRARGSDR